MDSRVNALLCLLVLSLPLVAVEGPGVDLRAEPAQLAVGESLELHVTYRWLAARPPAAAPNPSLALDGELVTRIDGPRSTTAEGVVSQHWRLVLVMSRSGTWAAPAFSLRLSGPDGEQLLRAPEVLVEVGTGGAAVELPAPSALWRPTVDEDPPAAPVWPWLLAGGLLVVSAIACLGWWLRRRHQAPGLSPRERFERSLPAASAAEDGKLAGALLSAALRRYCGERWDFDGVAATNPETVAHLRHALPGSELSELRRILDHLDGLRWSPQALAKASVQPLIEQATAWVGRQEERLARELAESEAAA